METQINTSNISRGSVNNAKDFFVNLGVTISLYILVGSLLRLLFSIINTIYPQITPNYLYYSRSASISWPVAMLIILLPVFMGLMWLLAKEYDLSPERKHRGIHRWLTYLTLFLSGALVVGDLVAVLFYFLDGQELTTGFLLKGLSVLVVASLVFTYYISNIRGTLTQQSRVVWRIVAVVLALGSIVWGFATLGSPLTQRLYKYDEQKVRDLMNLNSEINNYYAREDRLPATLNELIAEYYHIDTTDPQTGDLYIYERTGQETYNLCAVFNKASLSRSGNLPARTQVDEPIWTHGEGEYCFGRKVSNNLEYKTVPVPVRTPPDIR